LIRIGTRGSALALAQARWVAGRLGQATELVPVTTAGDRDRATGDKSRWVSALETALLEGEIDIAIHSAKDVPAELADGLEILAITPREDPADVVCGAPSLDSLERGALVGTSSLRRAAQLKAMRDDIEVVPIHGNVDTRLRKLAEGEVDALVLAAAGLARLGRSEEAGGRLHELVPAAGQGALLIEGRHGALSPDQLAAVSDAQATACVCAERELVHALGASCNTPVGAHAQALAGGDLELSVWVGLPDGSSWISDRLRGPAASLGAAVAERLIAVGARELLARSEGEVRA
jgi:hydroxymethylbilane synthase